MLVSHRKKFIYTKTVKTAGTSVESYFEKYCMPEGEWEPSHARAATQSDAGIIGKRGPDGIPKWLKELKPKPKWKSHMSAAQIKKKLGDEIWNSYFKFCVIRNPFDKMVSMYYMKLGQEAAYSYRKRLKVAVKKFFRSGDPFDLSEGQNNIERFRDWIAKGGNVHDRKIYTINGKICVDFFIQYEKLEEGIREVCKKLSIPFEKDRIPRFKSDFRKKEFSVSEFYDAKTVEIVSSNFDMELKMFHYEITK